MDLQKEPTTQAEWRAFYYKKQADILMVTAQGYEHEGDQVKADAAWALWTAKKLEIRNKYPD